MEKKLIAFDEVKEVKYLCSKCNKLVCEKFGCLVWRELESVPELKMPDYDTVINEYERENETRHWTHDRFISFRACYDTMVKLLTEEKGVESGD